MKQLMKMGKYYIAVLLGAWCIGLLGLLLVYCIPSDWVKVEDAIEVFAQEGPGPLLCEGYTSTRLDNYTDSLMINTAGYSGTESFINRALMNYHYELDGMTPFDSFVSLEEAETAKSVSYARYWHGYLVFLKPLLCIFDYVTIRNINSIFQIIVMIWILFKMLSRGLKKYVIPSLGMIIVLNPLTIGKSLQYSSIFYIMAFSVLYLLYKGEDLIKDKKIPLFMLIVGCITSYLDFLTYPIVTLCVPFVFIEILEDKAEGVSKKDILDRFLAILSWGIGYVGMWAGKWIVTSIFTGENIIKDAILSGLYRVSNGTSDSGTYEKINSLLSLKNNVEVLQPKIYAVVAVCFIILILILAKRSDLCDESLGCKEKRIVLLGIIGCIPFVWIMIMCNHSYVHYWMTFRNLAASVLAWGCMLSNVSDCFWLKRKNWGK